jgi:hypothetical protein
MPASKQRRVPRRTGEARGSANFLTGQQILFVATSLAKIGNVPMFRVKTAAAPEPADHNKRNLTLDRER